MAEHRGFANAIDMNDVLIARHNAKVKKDDVVYHLGDFSFLGTKKTLEIIEALNGKVHLVPGNHDKSMTGPVKAAFASVLQPIHTLKIVSHKSDGESIVTRCILSHFPLLVWDMAHYGTIHLHGHSHGNLRFPNPHARIMDVGVDCSEDLTPFSSSQILHRMMNTDYKPFDQHKERE